MADMIPIISHQGAGQAIVGTNILLYYYYYIY